jgi:hypothetical protein
LFFINLLAAHFKAVRKSALIKITPAAMRCVALEIDPGMFISQIVARRCYLALLPGLRQRCSKT